MHGSLLPTHLDYGIERLNSEVSAWLRGEGAPPDFIHTSDGPTWARDFSDEVDDADCLVLDEVLERLGARRMIVGHTVPEDGIGPLCDGRVWCIDAGLAAYYGARIEVLEIDGDRVRVLR
ncbi:MAG: hypothetical protein ABIK96_08815 [bacterium]